MYIDGHECEDVVNYCKAFVKRWEQYEKYFHLYDNDGKPLPNPKGFPIFHPDGGFEGCFSLILVAHDESTFFQNDLNKSHWAHKGDKPTPQPKGDGQSLMASGFLTSDWGHLCDGEGGMKESVNFLRRLAMCQPLFLNREARILFKPGVNCDGYFDANDLQNQVEHVIDIFEGKTNGNAQGLFLFDNAPSHQKQAPHALSARKMPKSIILFDFC